MEFQLMFAAAATDYDRDRRRRTLPLTCMMLLPDDDGNIFRTIMQNSDNGSSTMMTWMSRAYVSFS